VCIDHDDGAPNFIEEISLDDHLFQDGSLEDRNGFFTSRDDEGTQPFDTHAFTGFSGRSNARSVSQADAFRILMRRGAIQTVVSTRLFFRKRLRTVQEP
jgi:hypothetical protein